MTVAVWTAGEMVAAPVSYAYVADLAPGHMRGRYQGVYGIAWGSGTVTGPALGGLLFGLYGRGLWLACGLIGVAAAGLVMASRSRRPAGPSD